MACSKPTYVYADIETESLRADRLLQIAAVTSQGETFSIYINPNRELPYSCAQITGLYFTNGNLYKNGRLLRTWPIRYSLIQFKNWLDSLEKPVHLVFHNAFGFDIRILIKYYHKVGVDFPISVVFIHDTLPAFRKYLKEKIIENFKLGEIAAHLGITLTDAHNAIKDAECLKEICEKFSKDNSIETEQFLDTYKKPIVHFINKHLKQISKNGPSTK